MAMRPILVASAITARRAMKRDLYAEVTARIVAELEGGAAPWIKPWSATAGSNIPQNAATNRPYSGCNVILLWLARNRGWATPRFITFKQALDAGGHVRKGEHGTKVYFVKQLQVKGDSGDEAKTASSQCCASTPFSTSISATACRTTSGRASRCEC